VIVAGTGAMGMSWCRAVLRHPELELAGLTDADQRRALGAAIRLRRPDLPAASGLDGLSTVPADVCINATPPEAHFEVSLAALRRGLAVLSEKPFAASLAAAARLTAAARAAGLLLMVSQSRSYEPGLSRFREMTAGLGRLGLVTTELSLAYRVDGFRAGMAQPLLLDMAVHAFDAARLLTGARPVSVYCDAFSPAWSWFHGPAAATAVIEMTGGLRYTYTGSWCSEGFATSWNGRWRVSGEYGTACWDGAGAPRTAGAPGPPGGTPSGHPGVATDPAATDPAGQLSRPLDDFVRALRAGIVPWGECEDNLLTLVMAEAAIRSAASGSRVAADPLLAEAGREAGACV
jgi:predicted dehydrogenase